MAGSHIPTSAHHTSVDTCPLTLVSSVESGLSERLAGHVDGHLATFAEHMREGLLAASTAVGLEVMAELMDAEVTALAGPKGKHDADRATTRHGTEAGRSATSPTICPRTNVPLVRRKLRQAWANRQPPRRKPTSRRSHAASRASGPAPRQSAGRPRRHVDGHPARRTDTLVKTLESTNPVESIIEIGA